MKAYCTLLTAFLLASCAHVTVKPVTSAEDSGLRFYRPHPYLLVTRTSEAVTSQVIYLPDKSREYVVEQHVGIGVSKLNTSLENGWNLTSLGHEMDTKVPEMITTLAGAAETVGGLAKSKGSNRTAAQSTLYRFDFGSDGHVKGLTPVAE